MTSERQEPSHRIGGIRKSWGRGEKPKQIRQGLREWGRFAITTARERRGKEKNFAKKKEFGVVDK